MVNEGWYIKSFVWMYYIYHIQWKNYTWFVNNDIFPCNSSFDVIIQDLFWQLPPFAVISIINLHLLYFIYVNWFFCNGCLHMRIGNKVLMHISAILITYVMSLEHVLHVPTPLSLFDLYILWTNSVFPTMQLCTLLWILFELLQVQVV